MTEQTTPPTKAAPAKKAAAADDGDHRPVHMLVRTEQTSQGGEALADFEVFTAEIKARRGLDGRSRDWSYVQVVPGQSFREARAAQQSQLS